LNRPIINTVAIHTDKVSWLGDISLLVKLKLSVSVVLTSFLGYVLAAGASFHWVLALQLVIGGLLVTFAANAINQTLEKDFDINMERTKNRPVAAGRMKISESVLYAGLFLTFGIIILSTFNPLTATLGMLSFVLYSFVYTPLKRYSTLAVPVGAIPGALPVLIGCTAHDGYISAMALGLFMVQFLWQFPHFWSIGYLGFDDYKKAGFKMLPENEEGIDPGIGKFSLVYALFLLPVFLFLYLTAGISVLALLLCLTSSMIYIWFSKSFYNGFDRKSALKLMFASFFYMPLILLTLYIF
jgi:heme o synthase